MNIRTEERKDYQEVYSLNEEAFGGSDESLLIERIRASEQFIPELSLVAEEAGNIIGHVLFSKAVVVDEGKEQDVIVLAPVAVKPERQKTGIGSQLIQEGLRRCRDLEYGLVLLIGHPSYYPRLGFKPARQFQLELKQFKVPDEVFMVYEVIEGSLGRIKGELLYPGAFFA